MNLTAQEQRRPSTLRSDDVDMDQDMACPFAESQSDKEVLTSFLSADSRAVTAEERPTSCSLMDEIDIVGPYNVCEKSKLKRAATLPDPVRGLIRWCCKPSSFNPLGC